jgi:hypothetical protein
MRLIFLEVAALYFPLLQGTMYFWSNVMECPRVGSNVLLNPLM